MIFKELINDRGIQFNLRIGNKYYIRIYMDKPNNNEDSDIEEDRNRDYNSSNINNQGYLD